MAIRRVAKRCMIHDWHDLKGRCGGEVMRRLLWRSRIGPGTYVVSPVGDVFKVVEIEREKNKVVLTTLDNDSDLETPVVFHNRLSALVTAGYHYTNSVAEKVELKGGLGDGEAN